MTKNKLPKKVCVCGNTYRIVYLKNRPRVAKDGDAENLYGEVRHHEGEIRVYINRTREQVWRTLWHEALHTILWHNDHLGDHIRLPYKKHEEELVNGMALAIQGIEWQ